MTTEQQALVERIREALAGEPDQREVSMFGGRAFMVNGKLAVSAQKDGSMLVRVAAQHHDEILQQPGAQQAQMRERDMGPGWITVSAEAVRHAEGAAAWVEAAMGYNRAVTG